MILGKCSICGSKKSRFVKANASNSALHDTYYEPETGYCGINQLSAKTGKPRAEVQTFLDSQNVYTKFKPTKAKFTRRKVITGAVDDQWQADLIEMTNESSKNNKGFRYIMTCIDTFSKYAWAIPLKRKSADEVVAAFRQIFEGTTQRIPKFIQTDDGKEFFNSRVKNYFDSLGIGHFSTRSETKACVVERFNRTIKEKLEKILHHRKLRDWINFLDAVVKNYNKNTVHRTIKMTPFEASRPQNRNAVFSNIYQKYESVEPKFAKGDIVRVKKYKGTFEKGYKQTFTNELFVVLSSKRDINGQIYYHIYDMQGTPIEGTFYADDLCRFTGSSE